MKKLLILIPLLLLLSGCTCDNECYDAKARYEEQRRITQEQKNRIDQDNKEREQKRQIELMETPGYKESIELELQERQARALEKQANDVGYMRDSQQVKDVVTVGVVGLSILGSLLSD